MKGTSSDSLPSSTQNDGKAGALRRMAATLRLKFRAFARFFVGSEDPEHAPAPAVQVTGELSSPPPGLPSLPDDLLIEILAHLPPLPSSVPRASLVCKRWRRLLSGPSFLRRFRDHHQTPPLLGFIAGSGVPAFFPALGSPDRIPPERFLPPLRPGECWRPLGCRHGLALFLDFAGAQVIVWDPVSGGERRIPLPSQLVVNPWQDAYTGAVLVAAGDNGAAGGHLLSGDSMSPFKVVLVCCNNAYRRAWACLYDSVSGKWGSVSSIAVPYPSFPEPPAVLVGSALHWLLCVSDATILEFDTDKQSMALNHIPSYTRAIDVTDIQVVRVEDGGLGIVVQAKQCIQLWARKAISDGAVEWVLQKTIGRDELLSLKPSTGMLGTYLSKWLTGILGYDENTNVIVVATDFGTFMIQLDTVQFTELFGDHFTDKCYPYTGLYTAVTGGNDGTEILNNA